MSYKVVESYKESRIRETSAEVKLRAVETAFKAAIVVGACSVFPEFAKEYSGGVAAFTGAFLSTSVIKLVSNGYELLTWNYPQLDVILHVGDAINEFKRKMNQRGSENGNRGR